MAADKVKPVKDEGGLLTAENVVPVIVAVAAFLLMKKFGAPVTAKVQAMLPAKG